MTNDDSQQAPSTASPVTPLPAPVSSQPSRKRQYLIVGLTAILLLVALFWLLLWIFYFQYHESTDDAYAGGNLINVNAPVSGTVVAIFTDDTDLVTEGQLLVKLDDTSYQIEYDRQLAELALAVLQVRQMYDRLQSNQANVEKKQVQLGQARYNYNNRAALVGSLAISNEDFIHAGDSVASTEQELKQAQAEYQMALDAVGTAPPAQHPLLKQHRAAVYEAFYRLQHCSIYAPSTGYIAKRTINVGEWAAPSKPLMAIIPTDYVWVDANFKETQLAYIRVGQPAQVTFDIYGSHVVYTGTVKGIASGTGSIFSLIPPQNATGNWIKIVQRLPVRILLDADTIRRFPLRLGISALVDIDTSQRDLPLLAQATSTKPIAETRVFQLNMADVQNTVDQIIYSQLGNEPYAFTP